MTPESTAAMTRRRGVFAISTLLGAVTFLLYSPILRHGFSSYDDRQYILDNPHVSSGLSGSGLVWSLQCGYASNWHPLTWLSHMLDCSLFGLNPAGHHLTTLLLHTASTVLLFLLFHRLTGSVWRSFFVAACFGWHPVHVESVAWASERKDVLSACFWILTLGAYARYVEEARNQGPRVRLYYGCSLALFAAGLMSKPMVVTLPFVLLLMDYWPLRRLNRTGVSTGAAIAPGPGSAAAADRSPGRWAGLGGLLREKMAFFGLSAAACVLTLGAQRTGGALWSSLGVPLSTRLANALTACVSYLGKTFWPVDLAVIYPYPDHRSIAAPIVAGLFLAALTFLFVRSAARRPYLLVGWFWYLGTLVPVSGLVQIGPQAMADRYLYIPAIGLFVLVAWGVGDLAGSSRWRRRMAGGAGVVALAGCLGVTSHQIRYWQDDQKLFQHALDVTRNNYIACNILGKTLELAGKKDRALDLYTEAVRIEPRYPLSQYNLGTMLLDSGRLGEAMDHFARAVDSDPLFAEPHNNWGKALLDQGKLADAASHFARAVELQPDNPEIRYNLGTLELMQSRMPEALVQLTEALRLKPDYGDAHKNLAFALMNLGRAGDAAAHFAEVVRLDPDNFDVRLNLGSVLLEDQRPAEAEAQFAAALKLNPGEAKGHYLLATALVRQRQSRAAVIQYREALRLQPESPEALNDLAWVLAADPDPALRSGKEAVQLAERACQITRAPQGAFEITRAAALAETGQFPEAVTAATRARELGVAAGETQVVARAEELLKLFNARRTVAETLK
jgi:protein O-mannosyl-transferase